MSLMFAVGQNPRDVIAWAGHEDPTVTLRIYAQVLRRGPDSKKKAEELLGGMWGNVGQGGLKLPDAPTREVA
jgi:hypothetical protein